MSKKNLVFVDEHLTDQESISPERRHLDLPPELISYYTSIKKRFSNPIVEVRNGVCLGCFIALSSSQRQEIENNDRYQLCDNCGRILYHEDY